MIRRVTFTETTYNDIPFKFEAGTPNIADVIGLGAAIRYLKSLNMQAVAHHEQALLQYTEEQLRTIPGLRILGNAAKKVGVVSNVL